MVDYLRIADRSWPLLGRVMGLHALVYRATGGRIGRRVPGLPPMLLLEHVGAKSGRTRTTPLIYMPHDDGFVIVGAKGGHPRNPGWVHNLRAHPEAQVQDGTDRLRVRAREAQGDERARLWREAVAYNPQWGAYQRRTGRTVPLMVLERVS